MAASDAAPVALPPSVLPPGGAALGTADPRTVQSYGAVDAGTARLGWDPGHPALYVEWGVPSSTPKRDLSTKVRVLPELDESETKVRRFWQHPAFIVSAVMTLLAIIAMVALTVLSIFSGAVRVTALAGVLGTDTILLTWSGPADADYSLSVVDGSSALATDLSQLIRGQEARIPRYAGFFDDGACFIVRGATGNETAPLVLDAAALDAQGAQRICVSDIAPAAADEE